jgi:hypothetical protein
MRCTVRYKISKIKKSTEIIGKRLKLRMKCWCILACDVEKHTIYIYIYAEEVNSVAKDKSIYFTA